MSAALSEAKRDPPRTSAGLSFPQGRGRPVKFQATREEEFSLLPCRSALTYKIKTGVGADGRITAQKLLMYWDSVLTRLRRQRHARFGLLGRWPL